MFGFLIGQEVNDDAVALKKFMALTINKYFKLPEEELKRAIASDFDPNQFNISGSDVVFVYKELSWMKFWISNVDNDLGIRDLTATGLGKYAGFSLHTLEDGVFGCIADDGIAYAATGGAKKLVRVMCKKYGAEDMKRLLAPTNRY